MNSTSEDSADAAQEPQQEKLTEQSAKLLSTSEVISHGLGGFYSLYGIFFLTVCVLLAGYGYDNLVFSMQKKPRVVSVGELDSLQHNDYVTLSCEVDYETGLDIQTLGGKQYSLIPVAGTDNRLIIFQSGVTTEKELTQSQRTFTGRIVAMGWGKEYDVEANRIKLQDQFARENATVPEDALILASGSTPGLNIWPLIVGAFGLLVLLHFLNCLRRSLGFLFDRSKLVEYVNHQLIEKTEV